MFSVQCFSLVVCIFIFLLLTLFFISVLIVSFFVFSCFFFFSDCGVFVASFAEYFIDGKPIPSSDFDVEIHRDRLAALFYHYGMKKQTENIESESEAPPSLPKK